MECLKNYGQRFPTLYRKWYPKFSPRKRNAKRQTLSEETLKISEERRKLKSKGEGNIYPT